MDDVRAASASLAAILKALPLFADCADETLWRIEAISRKGRIAAATTLFRRGERPECLSVLLKGQVTLDTSPDHKSLTVIDVVRPISFVGLPPVLLDRPSLMNARTLGDAEIVRIAAQPFREMLRREPELSLAMLASISQQYRQLVGQVSDLKSRSAAQRLGCYLLTLRHEQGDVQDVVLPCDKRLLASRLGATPEHLSRAFAVLRGYGVSTRGRRVTCVDPDLLSGFARLDTID